MLFSIEKFQVLNFELKNKKYRYQLCGVKLKSVQCVKILGVKMASNPKFSHHDSDTVNKASMMLDLIERNFSIKSELYNSLVRLFTVKHA